MVQWSDNMFLAQHKGEIFSHWVMVMAVYNVCVSQSQFGKAISGFISWE
jgi:hypothetical protein